MVREKTKRPNGGPQPAPKISLELSTLAAPGDTVSIDGAQYELLNIDTLGLRDRGQLIETFERVDKIERKRNPTEGDERKYRELLRAIAGRVLPTAPADVLERLSTAQMGDVALAFFVRAAARSPRLAMLRDISRMKISARPSRGSIASTDSVTG